MGMDLTHASPGSLPGAPSIAGVVASYNSECVNYPASLRLQTPKEDGQGEVRAIPATVIKIIQLIGLLANDHHFRSFPS